MTGSTTRVVYGQNERLDSSIALERNGKLVCIATFDDYRESSINLHIALSPEQHYVPRRYLRAVFAYPFLKLKCQRLTALIGAANMTSIHIAKRAGFTHETTIAKAHHGVDLLVFVLWAKDCRFIKGRYLKD